MKQQSKFEYFKEWLNSHGVLEMWELNSEFTVENDWSEDAYYDFVSGAFAWNCSPQGWEFWNDICNKWEDHLEETGQCSH